MKLRKINILAAIALGTVITFTACSKDDGPIPKRVSIEDVPAISTNLETGGTTGTITFTNQAAFQGKFKVTLYFANAIAPAKVDVVVRKNAAAASVKLFKADVTALPASFTITAAEIAALFGAPLGLNDTYDFAPDIYVGTKKYEAFPVTGLGSGQGITGMSTIGYGEFVRFSVK
ncbi:MAG TPA: hypothetical protein VGO58_02620 [Chitinophagaceae bacterium]|jgi:hypothetical protein|nr:hypothetical protein [Chitinophagaceae bacterium]